MSNCFSTYNMSRPSYIRWGDDVCFVLDKHALLDFYSKNSLKQQSVCPQGALLWHMIPSQTLSFYSLMLNCLQFDMTEIRTHNLSRLKCSMITIAITIRFTLEDVVLVLADWLIDCYLTQGGNFVQLCRAQ